VSIIGGGIGGLTAATALRQGIGVTAFERNPELREIEAVYWLLGTSVQKIAVPISFQFLFLSFPSVTLAESGTDAPSSQYNHCHQMNEDII
jgi:glycine/D-amino acid oxidase-like deaminating enzyme